MNPIYGNYALIYDSWARDLSVHQVQGDLCAIGRIVSLARIRKQYAAHQRGYDAYCKH